MSIGAIVAKKRSGPPKSSGDSPMPGDRVEFIKVRVSGIYKEWLGRFADSERSDMSDLVDDALAGHAKAKGFEPPPKR